MGWIERIRRKLAGRQTAGPRFATVVPSWLHGRPAAWRDNPEEQVRHYKHWVYAATQAIAFHVAGARLALYARRRDGVEEVEAHPFIDLINAVNPFHTRFWLWAQTMTFLELTGNAYWYVGRNRLGTPAEVWLAHSQYMRVIPDRREYIRGYVYSRNGEDIQFGRDEIIHLKYPNPVSPFYGRGPLQAAADSVDAHEFLKQSEWSSFQQGIMPSIALESDRELTEATIERLRTQLQEKYASPSNAGRPLVLEKGLKVNPVSLSPREMDFLRSSRLTRDEILGIFRVPAAVAGLSEDVNRSVAEAMDTTFAKYCIAPKLKLIEGQLNQDLVSGYDSRLFCRFDDVVPEDREQNRADMEAALAHGLTTINEEREKLGLPSVPWGDKPHLPENMTQIL